MDIEYCDRRAVCRQALTRSEYVRLRIILKTTGRNTKLAGLVTRKQFGAMLGAGIAMMLPKVANAAAVTELDVNVKTPDGTADCYFVHPASGTAPGVLVWPDIFGLRPALRQMGKRLAESGYSVIVVNPFYRTKKAPTADAGGATPIQQVMPLARTLNETTHMTDAKAFIGWLDQQPSVAKNRKMGTQGYCMGGPMAFRTAACHARSRRRGRHIPRREWDWRQTCQTARIFRRRRAKHSSLSRSRKTNDMQQPNEKNVLKDAFAKANLPAEIEVYGAMHGWCPPDSTVYNEPLPRRRGVACSCLRKSSGVTSESSMKRTHTTAIAVSAAPSARRRRLRPGDAELGASRRERHRGVGEILPGCVRHAGG